LKTLSLYLQAEYDHQKEEIMNGKKMSELPVIPKPIPPPVPDSVS